MTSAVEVITSVQRRRRWPQAEKERIVAAAIEPGANACEVARQAGIHQSQLYRWRRELCGPRQAEPGFVAIAQMVHDIDLRDDRYRRSETAGVAAVIEGIALRFDDDHRRVAESAPVFDALYASLGGRAVQAPVLP